MTIIKKHYRTCTLCEAMCGIEISTQNNKILTIKGDKNDTFSRGHFCAKAPALQDIHEDPDRIKIPLKRTSTGWQEISWNEALDTVAEKFKTIQQQHGKDAVGTYFGNPAAHNFGGIALNSFFHRALASKNRFSATSVDQLPHHIVCSKLFGHQLFLPVADVDNSDFLIIIGGNPLVSNGSMMTIPDVKNRFKELKQRGGKLVVIDPRFTETAKIATQHHFIKPATDVLLLLAMINVLFAESLVSLGESGNYIDDISSLSDYVADYTPEKVASECGISAENIRQLVHSFTNASSAVCYGRLGVSVQKFGTLCQYLIMMFNILTGNLDKKGGLMFTKPAANVLASASKGRFAKQNSRIRNTPVFGGEKSVSTLADEIKTPGKGQIKAMLFSSGNPVISCPNSTELEQAFASLDFTVAIDFYINETTKHADIILPPVSPLEREHYDLIFHLFQIRNSAKYSPALFKAPKNSKEDWQITTELAQRLMVNAPLKAKMHLWFMRKLGPSGILNWMLQFGSYGRFAKGRANQQNKHIALSLRKLKKHPHGIDLGALKPCLPQALHHKNKKIDPAIDFFLKDIQKVYQQFFVRNAEESTAVIKSDSKVNNEFLLIGRRHLRSNNSWLHNSKRLVKGKTRCTAMLNPQDAERLQFCDEQIITVTSRVGAISLPLEISKQIMPGVISVPHGWGHDQQGVQWRVAKEHAGVNVNELTDEHQIDEFSGNAVLNGIPVWLSA